MTADARRLVRNLQKVDRFAQRRADLRRAFEVGRRQYADEFLAAVSRDLVARPVHGRRQRLGDQRQAGITGLVAIGVVVLLEVIDIDQQKRQFGVAAGRALPFGADVLVEAAPVRHPGQAVDEGDGFQIVAIALQLQMVPDPRQYHRGDDRLGDVIDGAGLEAFGLVGVIGHRGGENDGDVFRARRFLELAADLIAVGAGHHHVEDDDVRFFPDRQFDGFIAGGREHDIAKFLERTAHDLDVQGFVIDDEDFRLGFGYVHAVPPLCSTSSSRNLWSIWQAFSKSSLPTAVFSVSKVAPPDPSRVVSNSSTSLRAEIRLAFRPASSCFNKPGISEACACSDGVCPSASPLACRASRTCLVRACAAMAGAGSAPSRPFSRRAFSSARDSRCRSSAPTVPARPATV